MGKCLAKLEDLVHFPAFWKGLKINLDLEFRAFHQ